MCHSQLELEKESLRRSLDSSLAEKQELVAKVNKLEDDLACSRIQAKLSSRHAAPADVDTPHRQLEVLPVSTPRAFLASPVAPSRPPTSSSVLDSRRARFKQSTSVDSPKALEPELDEVAALRMRISELELSLAAADKRCLELVQEHASKGLSTLSLKDHDAQVAQYESQVMLFASCLFVAPLVYHSCVCSRFEPCQRRCQNCQSRAL